ncbi:C4-dicarboxylate transporter DcuC [Microvirga sp. W0021]|uniref:C4-dicarboxylate transporter DcuC n=1 Tax=Hohaiivirga grylli TaxID=3133970 RepID=A0ABV0BIX4_9HYPH
MPGTILVWVGVAVIIGVIYALIKQFETRLVLIVAGLVMCTVAGDPFLALTEFSKNMVLVTLVQTILAVMGFACVMKVTKCDAHLINLLVGLLSSVRFILVPAAMIVTAFINVSLPSAAGCAAAVGAILIPLMISLGVRPAMAAASVMGGTFGSMLSPGLSHNAYIAEKLMSTDVIHVIAVHYWADIVCILVGAVVLGSVAVFLKENKGYVPDADHTVLKLERPNIIYAMVPLVPVFLLISSAYLGAPDAPEWAKSTLSNMPWLNKLPVPIAMFIGAILGVAVTRSNPSQCVKEFFDGMGNAYASILGIIIAAGVFVAGMNAVGLVDAFIEILKNAGSAARWAAAFGPFLLAVITGSGDAAALAFNAAVSPHAEKFGMTVPHLASLATLAGTLGRTMSPLAGAAIVCAGIAGVNPLEIAKRQAPGMIICLFVAILMLQ